MDIVMQRGTSIRRAIPTDMRAGLIITWKEGGLVFSFYARIVQTYCEYLSLKLLAS